MKWEKECRETEKAKRKAELYEKVNEMRVAHEKKVLAKSSRQYGLRETSFCHRYMSAACLENES